MTTTFLFLLLGAAPSSLSMVVALGELQQGHVVEDWSCWADEVVVEGGWSCDTAIIVYTILHCSGTIQAEHNEVTGALVHG